jgi:hypothetical protein
MNRFLYVQPAVRTYKNHENKGKAMQNKKPHISLGVIILLVGASAFIAGRLINGGLKGEDRVSHVTPAPEIPRTAPEASGLLVERKDNTVILQSVSFDAGSGWALGDSDEPMDTTSGPKVEVVITSETIVYRTDYEFSQSSVQQIVEEATLDDLNSQMMITVWGRKDGDRIIADLLLAEHLKE